jgi:hypothetical protein
LSWIKYFLWPLLLIKRSSLAESGYRNLVLARIPFSITELVRLSRFDSILYTRTYFLNSFYIKKSRLVGAIQNPDLSYEEDWYSSIGHVRLLNGRFSVSAGSGHLNSRLFDFKRHEPDNTDRRHFYIHTIQFLTVNLMVYTTWPPKIYNYVHI